MSLSSELISQFVKLTRDEPETKKESVVSGTVVFLDPLDMSKGYGILLDGSSSTSEPIPVSSDDNTTTTALADGNRVLVTIRNHTAIITGNLSSPSVGAGTVTEVFNASDIGKNIENRITNLNNKITEFGVAIGSKVDTDELRTELAQVTSRLDANAANISTLTAKDAEITGSLTTTNAEINSIKGQQASFEQTTTKKFTAIEATIETLTGTSIEGTYANIDFSNIGEAAIKKIFSETGMITDLVVGNGTITGKLAGVTISGDLIEGNTVKADKLVVKGENGLYYKLNIDAGVTATEEVTADNLQNGLHGSAIIAKTITAEQISVTDLVAFGATIGGFEIDENAIHSAAKDSASNTTRGVYFDNEGQFVVGDASNYIKYFKDTDNQYKLDISMMSKYATKTDLENMEIGGRNFIPGSRNLNGTGSTNYNGKTVLDDGFTAFKCTGNWHGVSCDANNLILDSKAGDTFTYSVNFKTSSTCSISFFAMCYTSDGARVYPEVATGGFNNKKILTSNSDEEQDQRVHITFSVAQGWIDLINDGGNIKWTLQVHEGASSDDPAYLYAPKLERGSKATDWTPAPEDMATAEEAEKAQTTANSAQETASEAASLIKQLSDSISMLVTDGNGTSLMTQTEDGWTFSTSEISKSVNDISDALSTLTESTSDTEHTVSILQEAVRDLGEIAEYVSITTYENEPCIELGEGDSDFKLRITNTRMLFTEGSAVLAYFTNQSFHSKSVVVEEELQQGGFVWAVRANGNLGLSWKGVVN